MVIRSLNVMFQKYGKFIFGIFAILIIMAFMPGLTDMVSEMFGGKGSSSNDVARIFNKSISMQQYQKHVDRLSMSMGMRFGQGPDTVRTWAGRQAMQSLFMLKAAEKNGIRVSDEEVKNFILDGFSFKTDGKYDQEKFEKYLKTKIVDAGYSKKDLDRGIKESLMVQKYQTMISNLVEITDDELMNYFNSLNEKFTVKKVEFKISDYLEKVQTSDDKLKAYFETEKENYKMPAQYKVSLVKFEYNAYEKDVKISELDIQNFYDKNKEVKYKNKPLASVQTEIKIQLTKEQSQILAFEAAKSFEVDFAEQIEDLDDKGTAMFPTFSKGLLVINTDWFEENIMNVKGIEGEYQVIQAIPKIPSNTKLSEAVKGRKAAYVIFMQGKKPQVQAELEQVKDKVMSDFKHLEATNLARNAAKEYSLNISTELETKKKLSDITNSNKLKNLKAFTKKELTPSSMKNAIEVLNLASETKIGEISKTEDVIDGTIAVFVVNRVLPKPELFEKDKKGIEAEYKKYKTQAVWAGINEWIKKESDSKL